MYNQTDPFPHTIFSHRRCEHTNKKQPTIYTDIIFYFQWSIHALTFPRYHSQPNRSLVTSKMHAHCLSAVRMHGQSCHPPTHTLTHIPMRVYRQLSRLIIARLHVSALAAMVSLLEYDYSTVCNSSNEICTPSDSGFCVLTQPGRISGDNTTPSLSTPIPHKGGGGYRSDRFRAYAIQMALE